MLLISNNLGVLPKPFFPQGTGRDYEMSPYLSALADFRDDFTVISGLSHPGVVGGHSTEASAASTSLSRTPCGAVTHPTRKPGANVFEIDDLFFGDFSFINHYFIVNDNFTILDNDFLILDNDFLIFKDLLAIDYCATIGP